MAIYNKERHLSRHRKFGQPCGRHSRSSRRNYKEDTVNPVENKRYFSYQLVKKHLKNSIKIVVRRIPVLKATKNRLLGICQTSLKYKLFPENQRLTGYRIVHIENFQEHIAAIALHTGKCDPAQKLALDGKSPFTLASEKGHCGLFSVLVGVCNGCGQSIEMGTSNKLNNGLHDVNVRAVWGAMSSGNGASDLNEQLSTLNIPPMNAKMFTEMEDKIGCWWGVALKEEMAKAGAEERRCAIEKGNFDDGVPCISVICDGGWSKRTHKHSYNAYGGVGVIFGAETKKLLYIGVRNKYCLTCTKAKNKGVEAMKHNCYRNWTESSQAMESDIILNGFLEAEAVHGLRYTSVIADGDSSVFAQLQEKVPIWGSKITKLECANHTVKCLRSNLEKLVTEKPHYKGKGKLSKVNRVRLSTAVRCAIKMRTADGNVNKLRHDIINSIYHVLGFHDRCSDFCKKKSELSQENEDEDTIDNSFDDIFESQYEFWKMPLDHEMDKSRNAVISMCTKEELKSIVRDVQIFLNRIADKSHRLIGNFTTNLCESWMAIRAKFDGGKVINRCGRGSWHARCYGGALRKNLGVSWSPLTFQNITQEQAGVYFWKNTRRLAQMASANQRYQSKPESIALKRKRKLQNLQENTTKKAKLHYGSNLDDSPDVSAGHLQSLCEIFLDKTIHKNEQQISDLQKSTIDQSQSNLWKNERRMRLTSSNFGKIIHRRPTNVSISLVKNMLYSNFGGNMYTIRGLAQEENTIIEYKNKTNNSVQKTGLRICSTHHFLSASTDGIVNNEGLLEIKNFLQTNTYSIKEAVAKVKNFCLQLVKGTLKLKRNHDVYFQIQGQLNIYEKDWCDFVLRRTNPYEMYIERIKRDKELWINNMLPRLTSFYMKFMLPELALPRYGTYTGIRIPKSPWFEKDEALQFVKNTEHFSHQHSSSTDNISPGTSSNNITGQNPSDINTTHSSIQPKNLQTSTDHNNPTTSTKPAIASIPSVKDPVVPSTSLHTRSRRTKSVVKFVGRDILHEWTIDDTNQTTKWYHGTVLDVLSEHLQTTSSKVIQRTLTCLSDYLENIVGKG